MVRIMLQALTFSIPALAPLHSDFDGYQLQPSEAAHAVDPYSPARTAWTVLMSDPPCPLYISLLRRYKEALAPFPNVDLIICLSLSNYSYTHDKARAMYDSWRRLLPGLDFRLVTTADIGNNFPALAPILPYNVSTPYDAIHRPFEWAHHEPTLLSGEQTSVPGPHDPLRACRHSVALP